MANVDNRSLLKDQPLVYDFQNYKKTVRKRVNLADILTGSAGDVYYLITIPAECAVVGGQVIVTTAFGAATNGTMEFKVGVAGGSYSSLTGALLIDALAKGTVINLFCNDFEDTAGATYAYGTAERVVQVTTGTAEPATGVFDIIVEYVPVYGNT